MLEPTRIISAHGRHAQAVRFTADGSHLVSTGQDKMIRLWSLPDFEPAGVIEGHDNSVNSLSFTEDESILATSSSDGTVKLWGFPAGNCLETLSGQKAVALSQDGSTFATLSAKPSLILWDTVSREQIDRRVLRDARAFAIAPGPDAATYVVGTQNGVYLFNPNDAGMRCLVEEKDWFVASLVANRDRSQLAAVGGSGRLVIWNTHDWTERVNAQLGVSGYLTTALAPNGSLAVSSDHLIQIVDPETAEPTLSIEPGLKGVYGLDFSPDGTMLANAAADGKIRIWTFLG